MATDPEKYDSALLAILQNEGKVAPFLDVVLGFLSRRTDFFRIMKSENDRLGFPPGVANKLLENIFKKYESLAARDAKKAEEMKKVREDMSAETLKKETEKVPESSHSCDSDSKNTGAQGKPTPQSSDIPPQEKADINMETDSVNNASSSDTDKADTASGRNTAEDEDTEDPEQARLRMNLQANPLTYNGAEREKYYWSQTVGEADVRVKVPSFIVKGKQVKVCIQKKHISVSQQEKDGSWTQIVNGELTWEINTEESMWTLCPGEFVHISLEKKQERWWENVFTDEPKINTRKIDCSRPMTDLDDEAQAKIEEMMYNQKQKQMGLPQSHEQKTHEMLRKAWDAEGSPFKGQPFDPRRFSVDPSGTVNFKDS